MSKVSGLGYRVSGLAIDPNPQPPTPKPSPPAVHGGITRLRPLARHYWQAARNGQKTRARLIYKLAQLINEVPMNPEPNLKIKRTPKNSNGNGAGPTTAETFTAVSCTAEQIEKLWALTVGGRLTLSVTTDETETPQITGQITLGSFAQVLPLLLDRL